MSRSLHGPWSTPIVDTFDGRAFYAAKTAGNEHERFLFGWIPTRHENRDEAFWDWGGALGVHKIAQATDGTLDVRLQTRSEMPLEILCPSPGDGKWGMLRSLKGFDLTRDRVVVELYPRPDGNSPYLSGLERPFHLSNSGSLRLSILVDGDITIAYIDNHLALTSRMPKLANKTLSAFVEDGTLRLESIQIFSLGALN